jgi:hypothetical protein
MSKRLALAALIGLPMAFTVMDAQAQEVRYCDGRIGAGFFGSYERGSGGGSSVIASYMFLYSFSPMPVRYTVTYTAPSFTNTQNGSVVATLVRTGHTRLLLGSMPYRYQPGERALMPPLPSEIARYTTITCPP